MLIFKYRSPLLPDDLRQVTSVISGNTNIYEYINICL